MTMPPDRFDVPQQRCILIPALSSHSFLHWYYLTYLPALPGCLSNQLIHTLADAPTYNLANDTLPASGTRNSHHRDTFSTPFLLSDSPDWLVELAL